VEGRNTIEGILMTSAKMEKSFVDKMKKWFCKVYSILFLFSGKNKLVEWSKV